MINTNEADINYEEKAATIERMKLEHRQSSLIGQILSHVEDIAQKKGIISKEALAIYRKNIMPRANRLMESTTRQPEQLGDLIREQHALKPEDKRQIAQIAALESRILRTIQFYELGRRQRSPKEEFLGNFKEILKKDGIDLDATDPIAASAETPHLDAVAKTLPSAQIINVITKHPVEWETDTMRESEWELGDILKKMMPKMENQVMPKMNNQGFGVSIPPGHDPFAPIDTWTDKILDKIKEGKDITYFDKNTVPKENASANVYYKRIQKEFADVAKQYNAALDEIVKRPRLPEAARAKLKAMHIDKDMYELHTWTFSGDGDGRPDSNEIGLFRGVMRGMKKKDGKDVYDGPVIDLRHNAEEQRNLLSSAIQRKYLDSRYRKRKEPQTFKLTCDEFTNSKLTINGEPYNPKYHIFQQLSHEDQAEFAKLLLKDERISLVPKEIKDQVTDFLPFFNDYYGKFLKKHGLDDTTAFKDLSKSADIEHSDLWGKLRDGVLDATLERETNKVGKAFILNDSGSYSPLRSKDYASYFRGRKTLNAEGKVVTMSAEQRDFDIGIFRRLVVANHFIDPNKRDEKGHCHSDIFQRYKIANFSSEADFYIAMELFKEAGLITISKGKVTDVKMGIMPLLETYQDLENAEKIFGKLLEDDMVRSFWQQRGQVDIMVGYSDSSKSASSASSQEKILETKEKLIALFAKSGINVPVHVHEGPGYGLDRGGVMEPGAAMIRQPTDLQERGLYDATIQGTPPRDMAGYPGYGKHYLSSMVIGVMTGAQEAARQKDPQIAKRQEQYDKARRFIFGEEAVDFQKFRAAHQKEILQVIAQMPKNPDKSSRPEARVEGGEANKTSEREYNDTRMIGIEYATRQMKLPFFEIGLKHGLEKFIESGMEVPDAHGTMHSGLKGLQTLYEQDQKFQLQMNLRQLSMNAYRKDMAQQWGALTGTPKFVEAATEKLDGLAPTLAKIREGGVASRRKTLEAGADKEGKTHLDEQGNPLRALLLEAKDIKSLAENKRLKKQSNPYLDYFANATAMTNTLDMVAQTALLSEAYDPKEQKVVAIDKGGMNPKDKQRDEDRIRMLRHWELCTAVPIETQHISPLTADIRRQVEGRAA